MEVTRPENLYSPLRRPNKEIATGSQGGTGQQQPEKSSLSLKEKTASNETGSTSKAPMPTNSHSPSKSSGKRREGIRLQNSLQRVFNWFNYIHFISAGECNSNGRLLILSVLLPPVTVRASTRMTSRGMGRGCSSLSTVGGRVIHEVCTHFRGVKDPHPPTKSDI